MFDALTPVELLLTLGSIAFGVAILSTLTVLAVCRKDMHIRFELLSGLHMIAVLGVGFAALRLSGGDGTTCALAMGVTILIGWILLGLYVYKFHHPDNDETP